MEIASLIHGFIQYWDCNCNYHGQSYRYRFYSRLCFLSFISFYCLYYYYFTHCLYFLSAICTTASLIRRECHLYLVFSLLYFICRKLRHLVLRYNCYLFYISYNDYWCNSYHIIQHTTIPENKNINYFAANGYFIPYIPITIYAKK